MKIKILLNTNPFFSASASANRWLTLIEGLNDLKVAVQIVVVGNYQSKDEKQENKKNSSINRIEIKYLTSKIVSGLWQRRYYTYIGKYFQALRIKIRLRKEIQNFDGILWAENDLTIWKIISNISNKSFKLITEMSEFLDIHKYNKVNALQKRAADAKQVYFENRYINKLDGFVLMTKTLLEYYNTFNNHPPLLHLPMTVDFERFQKQIDPPLEFKKPYIAYVGVMNDAKDGINILIEAFYKISKNYPKLKLYLVGGWDYDTPSHQEFIKELELEDRVYLVGEYPRDTIPSIICNAKLLALPRPDSKQAQGGFPTKLGEYLATGRPVCATTVGEIPEYLEDKKSVYFAKPGSVKSFANSISNVLKDDEQANNVGEQGKKIAELYFNKKTQSKTLYNFLKQL